ncbi:uncharacterized protein J3R85_016509 [Psidium guajava]|nr:uncharacterized protein J3R85_016509 [Psidium guajava]
MHAFSVFRLRLIHLLLYPFLHCVEVYIDPISQGIKGWGVPRIVLSGPVTPKVRIIPVDKCHDGETHFCSVGVNLYGQTLFMPRFLNEAPLFKPIILRCNLQIEYSSGKVLARNNSNWR